VPPPLFDKFRRSIWFGNFTPPRLLTPPKLPARLGGLVQRLEGRRHGQTVEDGNFQLTRFLLRAIRFSGRWCGWGRRVGGMNDGKKDLVDGMKEPLFRRSTVKQFWLVLKAMDWGRGGEAHSIFDKGDRVFEHGAFFAQRPKRSPNPGGRLLPRPQPNPR